MEQKINKDNFEIAYISNVDQKIIKLSPSQLEALIPKF
jgi:hypothetical protein